MRTLVTGVTGSIGGRLAPSLIVAGHEVRALSRRPASEIVAGLIPAGVEMFTGDAVTGVGLREALEGVEVAYYLIHSMEPTAGVDFASRERAAAENFVREAVAAGVRRVIYLGGLVPDRDPVSIHLGSRLAVERILLTEIPDSVAFRASIVIGSRSRSFRFLVRLVERMRVMLIPAWRDHVTAPVDERDVIACLVAAASAPADTSSSVDIGGRSLDIAGPEVVSYGKLIDRIREHLMLERPALNLPITATPIASRVSAVIAGEDHALIGPLMEGLNGDLLPREPTAPALLGIRTHSLDAAIERALRDWEIAEDLRAR